MSISDNIKAIRIQKGIAQAEIARRLEIEPSSYHRLENRGDKLTLEQAESIAHAIGVSRLELLTWGDKKESEPVEKQSLTELQEKLKEITVTRDIAQEYAESLKRKVENVYAIFYSTISNIGEEAELGTENLVEESDELVMYYTSFTNKELMQIFNIIHTNHNALYYVFRDLLRRDIIDASRREAKLFLTHNEQMAKATSKKQGNPF